MEETLGAQYAVQIAVQTLRDRCKCLQHRVSILEEENLNLRLQCSRGQENENSLTEIDKLKEYIAQLTEQKDHLQNRIRMICNENQDLWNKLGKLTTVNKNLGDHLSKINETVTQANAPITPHIPLIRSKTFTQDEPQTRFLQKNLEINEKISLELEDISLKLSDSFSKQKMEFDKLCSEIDTVHFDDNVITENFGFFYDDELDDDLVKDVKALLENLKVLQDEAVQQKIILERNLANLNNLQENLQCKACEKKKKGLTCDRTTSTTDMPKIGVDKYTEPYFDSELALESSKDVPSSEKDRVCPVCAKYFQKDIQFTEFHQHVEDHFTGESYEIL